MWRMVSSELDSTVVWLAASPLRTVGQASSTVAEAVPLAEQQQALVVEHLRVDGFLGGPGMVGGHQHVERLVIQRLGQHIGFWNGSAMMIASSSPVRSLSRRTWVKFSSMYSGMSGATRCSCGIRCGNM